MDLFGDKPEREPKKKGAVKKQVKKVVRKAVKKAAKPAKKSNKVNGYIVLKRMGKTIKRKPWGEGKNYFPKDSKERDDVKARIYKGLSKVKPALSHSIAKVLRKPMFQIRAALKDLADEKKIKLTREGRSFTALRR